MKTIRNERGNAMIITLMLLIILTGLGIYAISISTTEMGMAFQWKSGTVGFNAAESGIYRAYDIVGPAALPSALNIQLTTLPNLAQYSTTLDNTYSNVAPGYGSNFQMAAYEISSFGNAAGSIVTRHLQAVVQFGPVPAGTGY